MAIPLIQQSRIGLYIFKQVLSGAKRYPLVLMLEPLFRCNLQCKGCGKIAYSKEVLKKCLGVDECIDAAESSNAPVVSIAGGEPLLHPEIHRIVAELTARKRFVYLCTNAVLISDRIEAFTPSPFLTFNIHLDGLRDRHDRMVNRKGVFDKAAAAARLLISKGFRVTTNTTFFNGESPAGAANFFDFAMSLGVEAMTVAPAFSYQTASDPDNFLTRERTQQLFREIFDIGKRKNWRFNHSRLYLDFLAGGRNYACTPWANPTRNIFGWQKPCYLLNDGYVSTFADLMETTDWSRYGVGRNRKCGHCMVHCGFEATAVMDSLFHPFEILKAKRRMNGTIAEKRAADEQTPPVWTDSRADRGK